MAIAICKIKEKFSKKNPLCYWISNQELGEEMKVRVHQGKLEKRWGFDCVSSSLAVRWTSGRWSGLLAVGDIAALLPPVMLAPLISPKSPLAFSF
jgi:hypothetical protein